MTEASVPIRQTTPAANEASAAAVHSVSSAATSPGTHLDYASGPTRSGDGAIVAVHPDGVILDVGLPSAVQVFLHALVMTGGAIGFSAGAACGTCGESAVAISSPGAAMASCAPAG